MSIEKIIEILSRRYKVKLSKKEPFDVLISTVLSHRTKDEISWPASERLLKAAGNLEKMNRLTEKEIVDLIKPVGFYNQKAKRIKQICKMLLEKYRGQVPKTREGLMELPGVKGKTADIVLSYSYGQPVIAVDTHVAVVSQRLGLTRNKYPEKIREDLHRKIPMRYRLIINSLFVDFGKEICQKRIPKCYLCPVFRFCKYEKKWYFRKLNRKSS